MPRTTFPMKVTDLSAFAKILRVQIGKLDHAPSHVEMLNLLTRAAGFQNYQHFRARLKNDSVTEKRTNADELEPMPDEVRVMKTARLFDGQGRIIRWPTKRSQQELCLWWLWSKIPRGASLSEREVGVFLDKLHTFGDAALLRRDLFDLGLVTRKRDGSDYRRVERKPPPELSLLTRRIGTDYTRTSAVAASLEAATAP